MKADHFAWSVMSTLFLWLSVVIVKVITGSSGLVDFTVVMAVLGSLALWLTIGFMQLSDDSASPNHEKSKRDSGGEDARLALLVQLMGEEERQALKQRLIDDLAADGEAVSLADLLADQSARSRQQRS